MKNIITRKTLLYLAIYLTLGVSSFAQNIIDQWMEAENNPSVATRFVNDKSASGGKATWGTRWYHLAKVQLPINKQPVYVYINAKTADNRKQFFQLCIDKKACSKAYLPASGKWCWTKLGPIKYRKNLITIRPNGAARIKNYLDGFVISTNANLTTKQLEELKHKPQNGQVSVGKCVKTPIIDGKLDDACWERCVTITPFLLNKSADFAKEQTQASITYDDKNIYVGFRCYARVLDPLQNRLHEFADKVKINDSRAIFKDDCVILLFAPDSKNCYELTVNANGAITDAKCKAPNYWESRNLSWNSEATAKGSRQNGFWTAEIKIPRAALGKNDLRAINFVAGRINIAMKESSAFSRINTGFHDAASFSSLFFRKSVPSVGLGKFSTFNVGINKLPVNIGGGSNDTLLIEQLICNTGKWPKLFTKQVSLSQKDTIEAPVNITGGKLKYRVTLRNAANSDVLLKTPDYSFDPIVLSIKAQIKNAAGSQLFVNAEANNNKLNHGLNVLALKAEKGISGKFTIGSTTIALDSSWKFTTNKNELWNTAKCDASKWQRAPIKDGILKQSGFLRKIIFVGATELWPNWNQYGVNICRGSSQQLFFPPRGLKGIKNASDYKMNIELPVDFELLGASSYYNLFKVSTRKIGTVKRNGIKYNKYQISLPQNKEYIKKTPKLHQYCVFAIRVPHKSGKNTAIYYYASADNSYIQEIPQKLKVNLLPPLAGNQPKGITFQLWSGWLGRMSDMELQKKLVSDFKAAGFNEIQKLQVSTPGLKEFKLINFKPWNLDFTPFVKRYPDMALVDAKGIRSTKLACPTALLNTPVGSEYFEKSVAKWFEKHKVEHVNWDYEHSPFSSYIACYCPRCLEAFGTKGISPKTIKNKYGKKWIDFMTGRMAALAGRLNDVLHKVSPEVVFSVYSGYQSERTKSYYGIDWSKLKGKIQAAMCGYGRSAKHLDATYKAIGSTKLILGAISRPYANTNRSYPTACSAAMLMRRLLDSKGGGVLVYALSSMDGRTFYAMSKVSALAAEYEDFFTQGKRADCKVKCNGEYALLEQNKQKLLIILNQTNKSRNIKVSFKSTAKIFDLTKNKKFLLTKSISSKIDPGEFKAYLIK